MFGQSFLDVAEAMLNRPSFSSILKASSSEHIGEGSPVAGKKRSFCSVKKEKCLASNSDGFSNISIDPQEYHPIDNPDKKNEKSVVIQIPPKSKRRRITGNYSATDIVFSLNCAVSPEERLEALDNAIETFDHHDRDLHDAEIEAKADIALVKSLVFIEFKAGFRREPREISTVLKALECVYRASSEAVGKSFDRVGKDLLHILVILIEIEIKKRQEAISSDNPRGTGAEIHNGRSNGNNDESSDEGEKQSVSLLQYNHSYAHDLILRKATKIMGHFARVGRATRPMARFPAFLGSTLNLINMRPDPPIPFQARLNCLWTIANLACNTDNMTMMMCTPNLVNSMVSICTRQPRSSDTLETIMEILRAKSIASRTVLNLSWSPENRIVMSENAALVQVFSRLAVERQAPYKSRTMQAILFQARRHSLASLRNICASPRQYKIALCNNNKGKLLDVLTEVALNETDQPTIDLSFSAIHNLAIEETAEAIVDRPALVLALKSVLLEDKGKFPEGEAQSMRCQRASATILVLERAITPDKPSYENLRELLDAINPTTNPLEIDDEPLPLNAAAV